MDAINKNIAEISPSLTLSITAQANKMKAEGIDVCSFGAGEPDSDTPDFIKEAAIQALRDGKTKYTHSDGLLDLREAISAKLIGENDVEYGADQICVSNGAKQACYNAILAICEPGDEVIIPAPYWLSYPEMVRAAGGKPVIVETTRESGWKMSAEQFEEAMTPRTKMVILNSPSNPTGATYSKEELAKIGEVASYEDIIILSDEIYEKLVYDDTEHVSIASISDEIRDLTITVNGFSKCYSMTGWRLGYTAAPKPIAEAISALQSHTTSAPNTFAQYGALAALKADQAFVSDMRDEYNIRRMYMNKRFADISNVEVAEPTGAFYFLADIEKIGIKSLNFAEKLLSRSHVAVIPGICFGNDFTVRFSYACGLDVIKEGLDRFEDFCRSH
ncbi:MAG: pyridoxal phosphate-dependent aminotransferase [Verrucomicrobiales bacterium]